MLLVYILAAISFFYVGNAKKLSVTSVSTLMVNSDKSYILFGSIQGGTLLYIKGTGFHQNPSLNYVFVGDYPCIVPDEGLKQQTLLCTTTSIYPRLGISALPIIVISNKEKVTAFQKFSYDLMYTPEITEIYPSHLYANQKVRIIGKHKIQDFSEGTKQVKGIFIGNDLCSRNGIKQLPILFSDNQAIQCIQASITQAGKYSVKEQLQIGYASKPKNLIKTSLYGPKYQYTVFPTVQLISPNNGSIAGEQLTIKGTGFPASNKDKNKIQVTLDGTECQIVQTSVDEIKCNLKKKLSTSSKIQNSLNISQYTYSSGSGFKYFNYYAGYALDQFQNLEIISSPILTLLQSGTRGELYSGFYGDSFFQIKTFEGYFYAPNSGNYTFIAQFSNEFKLYMNLNPGVPLIRKDSDLLIAGNQTGKTENPYSKMDTNLYKVVNLQGGKYYFMKAYFRKFRFSDSFKVYTEVPNDNAELGWNAPQIQKMVLNFTNQPLVYRFRSMGASSGFIKGQLLIINPNTLIVQVNISSTLPFNASAQIFCAAAKEVQARYFIKYNDPQCERFFLDENFNQLPPETPSDQVYGYEWIVKYMKPLINPLTQLPTVLPSNLFQATYLDAQSIDGSSPYFTQEKLQEQGPLINGTFKIIINGSYLNYTSQKIDFPYNLQAIQLQQSLRNFYKSSEISVTQLDLEKQWLGKLGKTWTIQYNNPNSQFPILSFDTSNLTGGAYGTVPEMHLLTVKKFSHNLLYNPLSFELMRTFTTKPSIVVTVNNISSLCLSNCQFTYLDDVPQVSSLSMNSISILFTLSQETLKTSSKIQLKINEENACKEIKIQSNKTISCTYQTNSDGLPLYTAGSYHPSVYLEGIGFLDYEVGVAPLQFDFGLLNPLPNNGSVLGSLEVILKGKGLPKDSSDLVIKVCDIETEIRSMSRQSLTIITPQIKYNFTETNLNCSIKVQYEKLAPSQIFQAGYFIYNKQPAPPIILSLSKTQSNPTKKGILQIFGSGFDSNNVRNVSSINVYLKGLDIDKRYQLKVMDLNDTWIKTGLSGGMTGNYLVQVEIKGKGYVKLQNESIAHFYYANTIESISPMEVSYFGGREIEINGKYFSTDVAENEVKIGQQTCSMVSASQTKLKCLPAAKDESITGMQYEVSVTSRQISKSVCNGSCSITYLPVQNSPILTGMSTTTINSSNVAVTIQGKNLYKLNSTTEIIAINQVSKTKFVFQPLSVNNTQIVWKTVSIPAGKYYFFVNVKDIGYSNATLITVQSKVSSVTASVSTEGGILAIQGFGFPERLDNQPFELQILEFTSRALLQPTIILHTSQLIKIQLSGRRINDKLQITIRDSLSNVLTYLVSYSQIKTPKAKIVSSPTDQWKNTNPIMFEITSGASFIPETVKLYSILQPNQEISVVWDKNATHFWVTNSNLQPGTYRFKVFNSQSGFYQINDTFTIVMPNVNSTFNFTAINLSVEGGHIIVTHPINSIPQSFGKHSSILVNGVKTQITRFNQTAIKVSYPPFIKSNKKFTEQLANASLAIIDQQKLKDIQESKDQKTQNLDLSEYVKWSDSQNDDLTNSLFDSLTKTTYYTQNPQCFIGVYFGKHHEIEISQIRYYPNKMWQKPSDLLKGARFEGSSDNTTWTEIKALDSKIQRGWNMITIKKQDRLTFRYFRFIHTAQSRCSLGEIALKGTKISNSTVESLSALTEKSVILSYFDGLNKYEWKDIVFTYSDAQTPVVQNVQPPRGNVKGGQIILLSGTSLGSGTPEVLIDGKSCAIIEFNQTSIKCTTSPRLQTPTEISFQVVIGGKKAITKSKFKYVYRWSDEDTWGVDLPPVEGDLIYIPPNMHLLIDQSTPQLGGIIAQNSTIEIADESDIQINTANLILMGAQLIAGTQTKPYQHKLTFKFFGVEGQNQIPFFGNKGIGCTNCKISLHGAEKQAWTRVNSIAEKSNHTTGPFLKPYGWKADDQIVVAPSSFNYLEGEKLTISQINQTSTNLELWTKQVFKYNHSSISEQNIFGNSLNGIQIGSLTRNIKLQGDQNSDSSEYGIHLTFIGSQDSGLEVKISNIELKNCGQPKKSRHCINFNRNSNLASSYINNSTASETYAKFISISSTNALTISSNVGYRVKGHNVELKDGTEQNNVIERNLMITALPYFRDLQSDVMVANYYISNPNNIIKDNVAGGSFYYGFLYDLKSKSDEGIYAKDQVCTAGYATALNTGNVAHSIRKIGVRIKDLYTRTNPCQPSRDDSLQDPWMKNPSKQSRFSGYLIYRVSQTGLMCDSIGHVTFDNFTMAQNLKRHMEFHIMNFTKEMVVVSNSTFIGTFDLENPPMDLSTKALVLPRSGSMKMSNILFNKYIWNQTLIQTCSLCNKVQYFTDTGQQYFIEKVRYENIRSVNYLEMLGLERQIIYDQDGSFSGYVFDATTQTKATIVKGYKHILDEPGCNFFPYPNVWDYSAVCGANITVRKITFMNVLPTNYIYNTFPSIQRVPQDSTKVTTPDILPTTFLNSQSLTEIPNSWSAPFVAGSKYKVKTPFKYSSLQIRSSSLFKQTEKGIIFKLVYNLSTEVFDVSKMRNLLKISPLNASMTYLDSTSCQNGEFYHNDSRREFQVCISKRNSTLFQRIGVVPVYCRANCPEAPIQVPVNPTPPSPIPLPIPNPPTPPIEPVVDPNICIKQSIVRVWSNTSQWPSNRLPAQGQNVTVHCNWTMHLDIDPAPAAHLIIDGTLIVPENREIVNVTADSIWVRKGAWLIGNETDSFDKKLIIQLNGNSDDRGLAVDPTFAGRKNLVVSGRLEIYGPTNFDEVTYLIQDVFSGSNQIKVDSANGWKLGDQIVLSTSSRSWNQSQKLRIQSINGQIITVSPSLQFFHHGSQNASVEYEGNSLFTASKVIYMSRNIKIVSGPSFDYGFSVFVYGFLDNTQTYQMGSVYLRGVQFENGGQGGAGLPALSFKNTVNSNYSSYVSKCSFSRCIGECVKFNNAKKFIFENNVLYDSIRSHIRGVQMRQATISSNIMIKSRKDPTSSENVSVCLQNKEMIGTMSSDNLTIKSNQCYGSQAIGFILPYLPCNGNNSLVTKNIAGGCLIGFFMIKLERQTQKCLICENLMAYNCKYGILGNPKQTINLKYNKLILTGNKQGLILRFTTKEKNNTAILSNSYLSPISDPNCADCNTVESQCSEAIGVRLLSITEGDYGNKIGYNSTQIQSSSPLDGKTFVQNVKFSYFKSNYSQNSNLLNCKNNFIFKAHEEAIDLVGSTHLYDSKIIESDAQSVAYFRSFDNKYLGLQGGCGQTNCTSLQNYFIQDYSGQVLGSKRSKLLPNNQYFANKTLGCVFKEKINGYLCNQTEEIAVLEFESIARDYNTRIVWPVCLVSFRNDTINQTLNVQKEWSYRNGLPEGKRKARFNSLIKLNNTYNLTFYSRAPADMIFRIQQKNPTKQDFGWVKLVLEYPDQNSIRINANGKDMSPIILLGNQTESDPSFEVCGSYKYVYSKKYIEFILTTDCKIRMSFVNSVKASVRLDQAVGDFFTTNGTGKFIDKMCLILGITDTSRLKIVGVYKGSTVIDFYVEEKQTTSESNATSAPSSSESASTVQELNQQLSQVVSSGILQTALASVGLGDVLSFTSTVVILNQTGIFQTSPSQNPTVISNTDQSSGPSTIIVIIISVIITTAIIIIIAAIIYFKCNKKAITVRHEQLYMKQDVQGVKKVPVHEISEVNLYKSNESKAIKIEKTNKNKQTDQNNKDQSLQNNSSLKFKNPFGQNCQPKYNQENQGDAQVVLQFENEIFAE